MRKMIYDRLDEMANESNGYVETSELFQKGFTTRQIGSLLDEHRLEKVSFGIYWIVNDSLVKPKDYKAIEISMTDPEAVICADSACYMHGLIEREPSKLSVATRRSDRHKLDMGFPTNRYYISDSIFEEGIEEVNTDFGKYYIYNIERSICDCFKYKNKIDEESFELIRNTLDNMSHEEQTYLRLSIYMKMLRLGISDYESGKIVDGKTAMKKLRQKYGIDPRRKS
ncbi:MAG: hypothetical protein J5517_04765 [Eubacterium sp.]|nr:hypothetical protein [Eubacterium sp.]